jgi:hypothetical protein
LIFVRQHWRCLSCQSLILNNGTNAIHDFLGFLGFFEDSFASL